MAYMDPINGVLRPGDKPVANNGGAAPYGYHYGANGSLEKDSNAVTWAPGQGPAGGAAPTADPYANMPQYPKLNSLLDDSGNLKSQYQLKNFGDVNYNSQLPGLENKLSGINLNTEGLQEIRKRALSNQPSEWANLLTEQQKLDEQNRGGNAQQQQASATSGAQGALAMRGGLSSGARERVQTAGSGQLAQTLQDVANQGQQARIGIGLQDEAQKNQMLMALPGFENQALQPELAKTSLWSGVATNDANQGYNAANANRAYSSAVDQANKTNAMNENARLDTSNLGAYAEQMKAYTGNQQAKATAAAGSGGKK